MKKVRKLLSVLLVMALALTFMPINAIAANVPEEVNEDVVDSVPYAKSDEGVVDYVPNVEQDNLDDTYTREDESDTEPKNESGTQTVNATSGMIPLQEIASPGTATVSQTGNVEWTGVVPFAEAETFTILVFAASGGTGDDDAVVEVEVANNGAAAVQAHQLTITELLDGEEGITQSGMYRVIVRANAEDEQNSSRTAVTAATMAIRQVTMNLVRFDHELDTVNFNGVALNQATESVSVFVFQTQIVQFATATAGGGRSVVILIDGVAGATGPITLGETDITITVTFDVVTQLPQPIEVAVTAGGDVTWSAIPAAEEFLVQVFAATDELGATPIAAFTVPNVDGEVTNRQLTVAELQAATPGIDGYGNFRVAVTAIAEDPDDNSVRSAVTGATMRVSQVRITELTGFTPASGDELSFNEVEFTAATHEDQRTVLAFQGAEIDFEVDTEVGRRVVVGAPVNASGPITVESTNTNFTVRFEYLPRLATPVVTSVTYAGAVTWTSEGSANAASHTLNIHDADDEIVFSIEDIDGLTRTIANPDIAEYITAEGNYRVSVVAVADNPLTHRDSEQSAISTQYFIVHQIALTVSGFAGTDTLSFNGVNYWIPAPDDFNYTVFAVQGTTVNFAAAQGPGRTLAITGTIGVSGNITATRPETFTATFDGEVPRLDTPTLPSISATGMVRWTGVDNTDTYRIRVFAETAVVELIAILVEVDDVTEYQITNLDIENSLINSALAGAGGFRVTVEAVTEETRLFRDSVATDYTTTTFMQVREVTINEIEAFEPELGDTIEFFGRKLTPEMIDDGDYLAILAIQGSEVPFEVEAGPRRSFVIEFDPGTTVHAGGNITVGTADIDITITFAEHILDLNDLPAAAPGVWELAEGLVRYVGPGPLTIMDSGEDTLPALRVEVTVATEIHILDGTSINGGTGIALTVIGGTTIYGGGNVNITSTGAAAIFADNAGTGNLTLEGTFGTIAGYTYGIVANNILRIEAPVTVSGGDSAFDAVTVHVYVEEPFRATWSLDEDGDPLAGHRYNWYVHEDQNRWVRFERIDSMPASGWGFDPSAVREGRTGWFFMQAGQRLTGINTLYWNTLGWPFAPGGTGSFMFDASGIVMTGLQEQFGQWYLLHPNTGAMQTGWHNVNIPTLNDGINLHMRYFMPSNGQMARSTHVHIDENLFLFDANGRIRTNVMESLTAWGVPGVRFFLPGGAMARGLQSFGDHRYLFNQQGVRQYGWQTVGSSRFFFIPDVNHPLYHNVNQPVGSAVTGRATLDGEMFLFNNIGVMQSGWHTLQDRSVIFFDNAGELVWDHDVFWNWNLVLEFAPMLENTWRTIDRNRFHFGENGVMTTGGPHFIGFEDNVIQTDTFTNGAWYIFNSDGVRLSGWHTSNVGTRFFDNTGQMRFDEQFLGSNWYFFHRDTGVMQRGWVTGVNLEDGLGAQTRYFLQSGVMATGVQRVSAGNGIAANTFVFFNQSGIPQPGIQTSNGRTFLFGAGGVLQRDAGMQNIGGNWYNFDANGVARTGWVLDVELNDVLARRFFIETAASGQPVGALAQGLHTIGRNTFQFVDGVQVTGAANAGWRDIVVHGVTHHIHFNNSGHARTGWHNVAILNEAGDEMFGRMRRYFRALDANIPGVPIGAVAMPNDFVQIGRNIHFIRGDGSVPQQRLQPIGGHEFFFAADGRILTGWQGTVARGDRGFFCPSAVPFGARLTSNDGVRVLGGHRHLFDDDGNMLTGLREVGGHWYFFGGNGRALTGWQNVPRLVLGEDGRLTPHATEFQRSYFRPATWPAQTTATPHGVPIGAMLTSGWLEIRNQRAFLDNNGAALVAPTSRQAPGGAAPSGTSNMAHEVNGELYVFNANGIMQTGWQNVTLEHDDVRAQRYFRPFTVPAANSIPQASRGAMITDNWLLISRNWFYVDSDGARLQGVSGVNRAQEVNGSWYLFDTGGRRMTGWRNVTLLGVDVEDGGGQAWRYFHPQRGGEMATSELLRIGARDAFLVDDVGARQHGRHFAEGHWRFFHRTLTNGRMQTGWQTDAENSYFFLPDGTAATGSHFIRVGTSIQRGWQWFGNDGRHLGGDSTGLWPASAAASMKINIKQI